MKFSLPTLRRFAQLLDFCWPKFFWSMLHRPRQIANRALSGAQNLWDERKFFLVKKPIRTTSQVSWASSEWRMLLCVYMLLFWHFVGVFLSKDMCFYHFNLFSFDKVSNFCNKLLTNQKLELVMRNCQWNCM